MRVPIVFGLLSITILAGMTSAEQVPDAFFGKFVLDKSENFDEFLAAKGVNWLIRQMIKLASVTKVLAKNGPGSYIIENLTSKKNTKYTFELGKTFEDEGLDGERHKITFNFKNGVLSEHHIRLNDPDNSAETYYYSIDAKDQLVLKMENNGIVCKRWFKRSTKK